MSLIVTRRGFIGGVASILPVSVTLGGADILIPQTIEPLGPIIESAEGRNARVRATNAGAQMWGLRREHLPDAVASLALPQGFVRLVGATFCNCIINAVGTHVSVMASYPGGVAVELEVDAAAWEPYSRLVGPQFIAWPGIVEDFLVGEFSLQTHKIKAGQ